MAEGRPLLADNYLGVQQPGYDQSGLTPDSHPRPEVIAKTNRIEIKFKAKKHVKVTHQLIQCSTGKEISELVFKQSSDLYVNFLVQMPEVGYYKLQIFALDVKSQNTSMPNVFNYLIHCETAPAPAYPFPLQYGHWRDGCHVYEPIILNSNLNLTDINWHVKIPNARKVAVIADGQWYHFEQKGTRIWLAKFSLDHLRGKHAKVVLCANFDGKEFSSMLEYEIE